MSKIQTHSTYLMSRKEAANYLGISPSTLANWASSKRFVLPYFRVGRAVRYRKTDLDKFIQNGAIE